ncbi:MAG: hypothetical protein M9887_12575, partial [Chitinophagales bacterium]|nr:hypothetical protein [Chitinophagales bacterium]
VSYIGAVSRDLTGLLRNKNYELNFRFYEGANPLRRVQVLVIPGSLFAMGILDPSGYRIADSLGISNNLSLRFLAGESSMAIVIIGESRISGNYYFIDDFTVYESREEQKTSPDRVQYVEREGYRYGFNGQEWDDEIYGVGNSYTAEFWQYDPRIGRRWNVDPVSQIAVSDYAVNRNNPVYYYDPRGDIPPNVIAGGIGAGIGFLIGGGIEVGKQSIRKEGSAFNWKAVGGSAVQGAVTGGVAGLTGGASLLTTATVAGGANVVGGAINRAIQGKQTTVINAIADVSIGAIFGAGGKYLGGKFGQLANKTAPSVDDIFTNSISTRGLAERLAQLTKYKGFQNANEVLRQNNPIYDLFDNAGNVVDVTTTSAQKLTSTQFTNKLNALAGLSSQFKNRTLQIYVKAGQYSKEELSSLAGKLQSYIKDNGLKNVNFSIDQVKK